MDVKALDMIVISVAFKFIVSPWGCPKYEKGPAGGVLLTLLFCLRCFRLELDACTWWGIYHNRNCFLYTYWPSVKEGIE